MGLVASDDCGREVSDRAAACPHCGCPISTGADSRYAGPLRRCGACSKQVSTTAVQCPHCGSVFCEVEGCTRPRAPSPTVAVPGGGPWGKSIAALRRVRLEHRESLRCQAHQSSLRCGGCSAILISSLWDKMDGIDPMCCPSCGVIFCQKDGCFQPVVTTSLFKRITGGSLCKVHKAQRG